MKAELAQLIALQKTDTNIRRLQTEIESIPERRAEIEKEFDQRAFEIRGLEQKRDDAFHERARVEKEIFEQKQRAERAERNLMAAKKPDEYTAAIREADAARKQISAFETQVLEQMEAFESAEKELGERAPEVEKLREDAQARFVEFVSVCLEAGYCPPAGERSTKRAGGSPPLNGLTSERLVE